MVGVPPRLRVLDLDSDATTVIDPGFAWRRWIDLTVRGLADGSVELYVAADVGENGTEGNSLATINSAFHFETDCYDGLDGDGLAVDGAGRLYFVDPIQGVIRFVEVGAPNVVARTGIAAGI